MKTALYILLAVLFIAGVCWFSAVRAEKVDQAMQDYEECMQERAGMSPSAYYQRFEYYPECY